MPREVFPTKRVGDPLAASHVNNLSSVCGRVARFGPGSFSAGHAGSFQGAAGPPPFTQDVYVVTKRLEDEEGPDFRGIYEIEALYHDADEERRNQWNQSEPPGPYQMDALARGVGRGTGFRKNDVVVAYYDEQRGMHIPVSEIECPPFADFRAAAPTVQRVAGCDRALTFSLEQSGNGSSGWLQVNDREYTEQAPPSCQQDQFVSSTGVYSFALAGGPTNSTALFLRVALVHEISDRDVSAILAVRVRAVCPEGIQHSLGAPLATSTYATNYGLEASANRENLNSDFPSIQIAGSQILVRAPRGGTWTFAVEISVDWRIEELSSQSISSSSSTSSSSSSSSSSTSSSSSSTSSSSTSSSSTSSSTSSRSSASSSSSISSSSSSSLNSSSSSSSSLNSSSSSPSSSSSLNSSSSSLSSKSSSAFDCVTLVSDVQFDPDTCELTVCYRRICFKAGLLDVHPEVCD